jgi:DNA-directed RNA polymerase specialized sigma24 family protein
MGTAKNKWRNPTRGSGSERMLDEYYDKLRMWGAVLTRGDRMMAQEIVHDLCLHFVVAKPDLSQVENLDGYLYTCLRHIYLSSLSRASREALQTVNIADFDSIQFALSPRPTDGLLDRQNELRRICNYAVWRKSTSKSASYFLLLFFHGYTRREVAEIAQLPIAAIYNKLKVAREELKAYLEISGKLRIATRDVLPDPELRVITVSSEEIFQELRQRILEARSSECLPEEILLAQYRTAVPKPIGCDLLSHIVSCDRCLSLLDSHFEHPIWQDREPPGGASSFDGGDAIGSATSRDSGYQAMMSLVGRQRDNIYEHRPRTLCIAVNGKIVAFHDVQSARSTLASRAEHPETVEFVEVFTDQQVRLALLPIGDPPPAGSYIHMQRVELSDDRRLELKVSFDGQGLHSEVTYLDPALAMEAMEEDQDDMPFAPALVSPLGPLQAGENADKHESIANQILRALHAVTPRFAFAWSVLLAAALGVGGYLAYRYTHPSLDAGTILSDSVKTETARIEGKAEHRILRLDALGTGGQAVWQGTVDEWQEPASGRTMRRLYNAQHRLLAAEWQRKNGKSGSYIAPAGGDVSKTDREVAASAFWQVDVSAREFQALAARHIEMRTAGGDYELTGTGFSSAPAHFIAAILVVNHNLRFVRETLRINGDYLFTEVRFVETTDERVPPPSVPDTVFDPSDFDSVLRNHLRGSSAWDRFSGHSGGTDTKLVQTELAVLYRLSELGADIGEPIQVTRTPSGHVRVAGTIANEARKRQIVAMLEQLPDRQVLEIQLVTEGSLRMPISASRMAAPPTSVYDVAPVEPPADSALRKYFQAKGLAGKQIDVAIAQFSRDALDDAQRALQHAYALDRLGSSFSAEELRTMGPVAQEQWSAMVARHSLALEAELDKLHEQIAPLVAAGSAAPWSPQASEINNPADFVTCARGLLRKVQKLNREVGSTFSSGLTDTATQNTNNSIEAALESIPLSSAEQLADFGSRMVNTKDAANDAGKRHPRLPEQVK